MADIFDEVAKEGGDIFDEVAAANPRTAYNPVTNTTPEVSKYDIAMDEVPAFLGSNLAMAGRTAARRIPLAALGAAGAEGYHQAYQALTGDPNTPVDMLDSARRMALDASAYGAGQSFGEATLYGIAKAWPNVKPEFRLPGLESAEAEMRSYMGPYVKPGASERIMDWLRSKMPESMQWEQYQKPGFTLAQKTDPFSGVSRMEQIVESSFTGRGPISKFKWAQEKALKDWSDNLTSEVWAGIDKVPPSEQGKVFTEAFEAANKKFNDAAKELYSQVDSSLSSKPKTVTWPEGKASPFTYDQKYFVEIKDIKAKAKEIAKKNEQYRGIGSSEAGDKLIQQISELPEDVLSFAEAAELRSRLFKSANQMEGKDVAKGWAKSFGKDVDAAMEKAAESVSPEAKNLWRKANAFYKEGKQTFDNDFIRGLVEKGREQPELVGKALFQNGEISQIKAAQEVLKENPQAWQSLKAGYLESLIENAKTVSTDPTMIGKSLSKKLKDMGEETLKSIFTTKELLMIKNFEMAALASQGKAPGSGGSMLVQLLQGGAVGSVISGGVFKQPGLVASGIGLLGTPRVLANMMVNPKWHTLFMQGLSTDSNRAIPAITKLSAGAVEVEREYRERTELNAKIKEQAQYR